MFPSSTQRENWTFASEEVLENMRNAANKKFVENFKEKLDANAQQAMLSLDEERILIRYYESQMKDLCKKFVPTLPKPVVGTSFHYFKRFYLNNSVMDHHPKEILVTCVYFACKIEEFNLSIDQFVANIKGDRSKAKEIIINNEFIVMDQMKYYLTIHNPYRPVEGFIIDIKTRSNLKDADKLKPGIDDLLDKLLLTDMCLLHSPQQLALAAILHSASKNQENLDSYVTQTLLNSDKSRLTDLIDCVRKIRSSVKTVFPPSREVIKNLEKRLELCRNQENNPDSQIYKDKAAEMVDEDDARENRRYARAARKQAQTEAQILTGIAPLKDE